MLVAGIDIGSTQSKGVILDESANIVAKSLTDTKPNLVATADETLAKALEDAGLDAKQIKYVVGTGYGRFKVTFGDTQISEISCHAKGANFLFPGTRTLLDIGGQDTKVIRTGDRGEVLDFNMNDKCAAGTGRFLVVAGEALKVGIDRIGTLSFMSQHPVRFSSTCTVFVETEIFQHLSRGKKPEDLLKGMYKAITNRCIALMSRVGIEKEITFTGGVAKNAGMVRTIEEALGTEINVSADCQHMGAIGAALFGLERAPAAQLVKSER